MVQYRLNYLSPEDRERLMKRENEAELCIDLYKRFEAILVAHFKKPSMILQELDVFKRQIFGICLLCRNHASVNVVDVKVRCAISQLQV